MPHAVTARRRARFRCAPSAALCAVALLAAAGTPRADPTTDCFADRVARLDVGAVSSTPAFNTWQPGMVLGPPGPSTPTSGSLSVVSLGHGGSIVLEFVDNEIIDRPGPDLIVFENAFFCTAAPQTADEPFSVFAEPGIVEVSEDGVDFLAFPFDAAALSQVQTLCTDDALLSSLRGLTGITPSFTGDWTTPDDPDIFDNGSPGGVSGAGGDAFDLATLGLARARFVRITDPDLPIGIPGSSEGLDLDAVIAIHARPRLGQHGPDRDGDGLPDLTETEHYLTNPDDPDSDGDGVDDGEEAASCRDPLGSGGGPTFLATLDLEIAGVDPTVARWNYVGPGIAYDVARGDVGAMRSIGGTVDLGVVTCFENDSTDLTTRGLDDAAVPDPGEAFFYFVRQDPSGGGGSAYGRSSAHEPRQAASGDCP